MQAKLQSILLLAAALGALLDPVLLAAPQASGAGLAPDAPLSFRAQLSCATQQDRVGYKLGFAGAAPLAPIWFELEDSSGATSSALVRADLDGCFERVVIWTPAASRAPSAAPLLGALQVRAFSRSGSQPLLSAWAQVAPPPKAKPAQVQSGKLVISEVMKDPKAVGDSVGEWIEVVNRTAQPLNLEGWTMSDGANDQHTIQLGGQGLWIAPGQHAVLGRSNDPFVNGIVPVDYVYTGFTLANGSDAVRMIEPTGILSDAIAYDDGIFWPDVAGASLSLSWQHLSALENDDPNNWCPGFAPWSSGNPDLGTPGSVNPACP